MATINKTVAEINQSLDFADELRQLKTPEQIEEGVSKGQRSKRKPYASVAAMIADDSIEVGEIVGTASYYNDWAAYLGRPEGSASYTKVEGQGSAEDGYNFIYSSDGNTFIRIEGTGECPEAAGCRGDDQSDDTLAMQAYFNSGVRHELTAGKIYLATNLVIPNILNWSLKGNRARIKKISSDDNYYLVAAFKHINNVAEAQSPIDIIDVIFDGNDIAQHPLIVQNWNSYIEAETLKGTRAGCLFAGQTRDGATFPSSSLVNTKFLLKSHHNGGCGFLSLDSERNNATDGYILEGSYFYHNADYGVFIEAGAGWDIHCNTYANGGGIAFESHGKGTRVHDSFIDDGDGDVTALPETGLIWSCSVFARVAIGLEVAGLLPVNNCKLHGPVAHKGTGNSDPHGILSKGNTYELGGYIWHLYFGLTAKTISINDTFKDDDPFRWHQGGSPGWIIVKNAYLVNEDRFISGRFQQGDRASIKASPGASEYGEAYGQKSINIQAGQAFDYEFDVPYMRNYDQRTGMLTLVTRFNHNGGIRIEYVGMVSVKAKLNGSDSWVASLTNVVFDAAEWTVPPSVSVSDNGDGTGTLTLSGEPSDDDGYGKPTIVWS